MRVDDRPHPFVGPVVDRQRKRDVDDDEAPWRSVVIHAAVLVAWIALFVLAFVNGGVLAWSVGIAYIAYDTMLQGFVGWHTWSWAGRALRQATSGRAAWA